jgi:hypothetical protein
MQIVPGDAHDVVWGYGVDALAKRLEVVEAQPEEDGVQDLRGDLARRLDRERERAGQVFLRARQLPIAHGIAEQFPDLVDDQP